MSFFDDVPQPPPPPEHPRFEHKPWMGPPPGWVGGWVPWHIELIRNENIYSVLTDVAAYPTGVEFTILARFRPGVFGLPTGPRRRIGMPFQFAGPDAPRLGIGFSDGSKAVTGTMLPFPAGEPGHPVLMPRGGGGGPDEWRQGLWLWPLPPAGPLQVVILDQELGAGEHSVTLDAGELATAAERAEQLWEIDPNELRPGPWGLGGGGVITTHFGEPTEPGRSPAISLETEG